jgi:hypothetical protein
MGVEFWDWTGEEQVREQASGTEISRPLSVKVTDEDDSLEIIKRDISELQRWQPHPTEANFWVEEFELTKRYDAPLWWQGTVRWVNAFAGNSTLTLTPTDIPARLTGVRTETQTGATIRDWRGELILNSAGDLVTPIEKPERIRVFSFQKYLAGIQSWLFEYEDCVNEDSVLVGNQNCAPQTLLFRKVDIGDEEQINNLTYRSYSIELAYRPSLWTHRFPSNGYNELVRARDFTPGPTFNRIVPRLRPILIEGQRPTQPQLLDDEGKWLPEPEPTDVFVMEAEIFQPRPFNVLPLR